MAAPTVTARQTPSGIKLRDGFSAKIAFARDPDVSFWEKNPTPPGVDGGDAIDQTTMHNVDYRTMAARSLMTLTPSSSTVAYDPNVYNNVIELINQPGSITHHFSDGSTLSYFGYLKSFTPDANQEGVQPEATIEIIPTNYDPDNDVEAGPLLTSVAGT